MRVAIIGAGIAGLACADALAETGHEVLVFDKGRSPGGRMSTRRVEANGRTLRFDHGAQYFTARDSAFVAQAHRWEADGIAAHWPAAGEYAWVGVPGMNAPVRAMAARHHVVSEMRIAALRRAEAGWRLDGAGDGRAFDAALVAVPAEQAVPLFRDHHPGFADAAAAVRSEPCWTAMAAFARAPATADTILRNGDDGIGWAARDGSKPGREGAETWVVQANADWSTRHLEEAPDAVARLLLAMLGERLRIVLPAPVHLSAHRWRYAKSGRGAGKGALWDPASGLGACGDWLGAPRVEAAWLSGRRLAEMIGAAAAGGAAHGG